MPIGKVKFFSDSAGYGFIVPEDNTPDVFVHLNQLRETGLDTLAPDQRVSFDVLTGRRNGKTCAANVRLL